MKLKIVNIIDSFTGVNFGIWNAAISTANALKNIYNVDSELWFPEDGADPQDINSIIQVPLKDISTKQVDSTVKRRNIKPADTIVVTHGCWQFPTRWGAELKKRGFKWIYVPHGMLEPWSMQQKKIKKTIYFNLIEHPLTKKADYVRAVGTPEFINLKKKYKNTVLIPNGIDITKTENTGKWDNTLNTINYLFLARLHHKKGIVPLVNAWIRSPQRNSKTAHLYIAGPDHGELSKIKSIIKDNNCNNITYTGPVYGKEKQKLTDKCHIYLLPSHSEGFPTSVLEAMNNNLLSVITKGCNFPEALENNVAIKTTPETDEIIKTLTNLYNTPFNKLAETARKGTDFVKTNYSLEVIAQKQMELYRKLLNH